MQGGKLLAVEISKVLFISAGMESLERGVVTGIGVNHCDSGGNDGARMLVASVSGRILIWG